jgi:hypothetical protein
MSNKDDKKKTTMVGWNSPYSIVVYDTSLDPLFSLPSPPPPPKSTPRTEPADATDHAVPEYLALPPTASGFAKETTFYQPSQRR